MTLTFEDQRHERNHRGLNLGDHFSVTFVVPAGVLAFRRRGLKVQIGSEYHKDDPHSLPQPPALDTSLMRESVPGCLAGGVVGRGLTVLPSPPGKTGKHPPTVLLSVRLRVWLGGGGQH